MELLDIYDEEMNFIGTEDRLVVHEKGFWHKTVQCWLYDDDGNIYFQIRKDCGKLYTTASGHVRAGETVKQAYNREMYEEVGITTDLSASSLIMIYVWQADDIKNSSIKKDRCFSYFYKNKIDKNTKFHFDNSEVLGIVRCNAEACRQLLNDEIIEIDATQITNDSTKGIKLNKSDFFTMPNEISLIKYGHPLESVILATKNSK